MVYDRAVSGVLFYGSTLLLLVVLVFVFWHVRKYHGDAMPLNRKLFLPYDKRYPEKVQSGEVLFIQGTLSHHTQLSLKAVGILVAIMLFFVMVKYPLPFSLNISERTGDMILATLMPFSAVPDVVVAFKALRLIKKDNIRYFPPPPKKPSYFDYTGSRITEEDIKKWQRVRTASIFTLPMVWFVCYFFFSL